MVKDTTKGFLFALVATLSMSNVFIFSKAALNELSLYQFGVFWFGLAILWNIVYAIPTKKYRVLAKLTRQDKIALIFFGLVEMVGAVLFFAAIQTADNPAIMSFLMNLVPLFVIVLGFIFLKERFNSRELTGIFIILMGAVITSYTGTFGFRNLFVAGTGLMVLSTLFVGTGQIIAKRFISTLDPGLLAINRSAYLFVFALILLILNGDSLIISKKAWFNVGIGSLIGPFLTAFSSFSALQYIEASKSAILQSTKGLFVVAGSYMYFGILPQSFQFIGGLISIAGVVLLILGSRRRKLRKVGVGQR